MRRRPKYKRHITPPPAKHIFVVTIVFLLFFTSIGILIVDKAIEPRLRDIAEAKTEQFLRLAVNAAFSKRLNDELGEELIVKKYNNEGYVSSASVNNVAVNKVLRGTTNRVENFLSSLEKGELPDVGDTLDKELQEEYTSLESVRGDPTLIEIPVGQVFNTSVLANLGPKIPVNFHVIGNVQSERTITVEEPGINTKIMDINIHLTVHMEIVLPFSTDTVTLEQEVPVASELIEGDVPEYFNNGGEGAGLTIPTEPLQ